MNRTEQIMIKVSKEEKEKIQQKAKENHLDISNYIRFICLK